MYCFMGSGMLSNSYDENVAEGNAKECEKIADEFAIGFAEWLLSSSYFFSIGMKEMTFEQVLKIYKKEKGL